MGSEIACLSDIWSSTKHEFGELSNYKIIGFGRAWNRNRSLSADDVQEFMYALYHISEDEYIVLWVTRGGCTLDTYSSASTEEGLKRWFEKIKKRWYFKFINFETGISWDNGLS